MRLYTSYWHHKICSYVFVAVLLLLLSACGTNSATGAGSPSGSTPVSPTPTSAVRTVHGYGTSHGCPSDVVVGIPPSAATVITQPGAINQLVTAHVGDVVEVRAPFGAKWSGPTGSQGGLDLQQPFGYALNGTNACIWRFTARGVGTTSLHFSRQALCHANEMCPMFIANMPVNVTVRQ